MWWGKLGWVKWCVGISIPNCLHIAFQSKTLSHMWGKLNLHIFLFNVGLLTLIQIDSDLQFSLRPDEVHSSGWKLVFNNNKCSGSETNLPNA